MQTYFYVADRKSGLVALAEGSHFITGDLLGFTDRNRADRAMEHFLTLLPSASLTVVESFNGSVTHDHLFAVGD